MPPTRNDTDPVLPTEIEHKIDEIWSNENADQLEQHYNFLDYHFEVDGVYLRARAYLDEIQTVTLFGPLAHRGSITKVANPKAETAVLSYLHRRFQTVRHH